MKVKHWMIKEVIRISPEDTLGEALRLMREYSIRHLPVTEKDRLVGFLTESTLRQYVRPEDLSRRVREIMIVRPITVSPEATIEEAARLIYRHKIGGLPVVEGERLVGILTITDLLEAFIEFMGLLRASSRIDVIPRDPEGLEGVLDLIRAHGGKVISIGMEMEPTGEKIYHIRLEKMPLEALASALEVAGHRVVSLVE
ncbi:CBS domain-containing protein [Thermosulfurimonas marina]|uniref:CBS domain-containing protein n=1 Tax=Thermosulfurimonas marina TaxID=2047767 RepID=A0A6H1WT87_9BACT|nr:CBS domain-containing protein [Thermosulfurimonas marina]QJA06364.1 CBS domain-containing protein [Thermosulfurimonas marina]